MSVGGDQDIREGPFLAGGRCDADLENLIAPTLIEQIRAPEVLQCSIRSRHVLRICSDPKVHVFCVPRHGMVGEREPADDEGARAKTIEKLEEILEIVDRLHLSAPYPPGRVSPVRPVQRPDESRREPTDVPPDSWPARSRGPTPQRPRNSSFDSSRCGRGGRGFVSAATVFSSMRGSLRIPTNGRSCRRSARSAGREAPPTGTGRRASAVSNSDTPRSTARRMSAIAAVRSVLLSYRSLTTCGLRPGCHCTPRPMGVTSNGPRRRRDAARTRAPASRREPLYRRCSGRVGRRGRSGPATACREQPRCYAHGGGCSQHLAATHLVWVVCLHVTFLHVVPTFVVGLTEAAFVHLRRLPSQLPPR